jgi:hypothetical protein
MVCQGMAPATKLTPKMQKGIFVSTIGSALFGFAVIAYLNLPASTGMWAAGALGLGGLALELWGISLILEARRQR